MMKAILAPGAIVWLILIAIFAMILFVLASNFFGYFNSGTYCLNQENEQVNKLLDAANQVKYGGANYVILPFVVESCVKEFSADSNGIHFKLEDGTTLDRVVGEYIVQGGINYFCIVDNSNIFSACYKKSASNNIQFTNCKPTPLFSPDVYTFKIGKNGVVVNVDCKT